jgi:hypothetical protein
MGVYGGEDPNFQGKDDQIIPCRILLICSTDTSVAPKDIRGDCFSLVSSFIPPRGGQYRFLLHRTSNSSFEKGYFGTSLKRNVDNVGLRSESPEAPI